MNNSVFGKTMESLRNRNDVRLVYSNEIDKTIKLILSPLYARATVYGVSLAAIRTHEDKIFPKHPVYTGMCILDLGKMLMYDFYYNYLKLKYGSRCDLLYTDTDSLLLAIKTTDVCKDMEMESRLHDFYDTSDFSKDHFLHSQENKKVIGEMEKNECAGTPISETVCLRSKMYSIMLGNAKNIKKGKGTKKLLQARR